MSIGSKAELFAPLEALFCDLERVCGVGICVHDLRGWTECDGVRQLPPERYVHLAPFCMRAKAHREGRRLCGISDFQRANGRGLEERAPFLKRCHAGVWEVVVPIIDREQLQGSVFGGVCRGTGEADDWAWSDLKTRRVLGRLLSQCPCVDDTPLMELGRILAVALPPMLEAVRAVADRAGRDLLDDRIQDWVAANFRRETTVHDLAADLSLSASRAAHVVKDRTGVSFGRLVAAARIAEAKGLLRFTDIRIGDIARNVGYSDSNYFSRVFSAHTGMAPREFRKQRWAEDV